MSLNFLLSNAVSALKNAKSSSIQEPVAVIKTNRLINECLTILKQKKYILNIEEIDASHKKVFLNFFKADPYKKAIDNIAIISRPSKRVYVDVKNLKKSTLFRTMRLVLISSNLGLLTLEDALKKNVGGEVVLGIKY
jgi:ribosomal protein S8